MLTLDRTLYTAFPNWGMIGQIGMDENKFFKWLWRVNAILITGVLAVVIGRFMYQEIRARLYPLPPEITANLQTYQVDKNGETVVAGKWRYGEISKVTGEPIFIVPLYSIWRAGDPSSQRWLMTNLLFTNSLPYMF